MRRMFSEKQIKEMISAGAQSEIAGALEGDISIGGDLSVDGDITGDSIIENMSGYSFVIGSTAGWTYDGVYAGVVKNGNKLTLVAAINITRTDDDVVAAEVGQFIIPSVVGDKLFPTQVGSYQFLDVRQIPCAQTENAYKIVNGYSSKISNTIVRMVFDDPSKNLTKNVKYYVRYELTFLLSDNMLPSGE